MRFERVIASALTAAALAAVSMFPINSAHAQGPITYNPYPPGVLPTDINSELLRVRREANTIEAEAIKQWKATPAPILTGQPPILQNTGQASVQILGKLMNFDTSIGVYGNYACGSCHMPYVAFSGPIPSVNLTMIAYPGSVYYRAQKRTAQRYTYASYFPVLQYNAEQGLFFGGNFWDSRATGYLTRNPAAEQAQFPPVDPGEMGNPDIACIAYKLSLTPYVSLFEEIWGADSLSITWPSDVSKICSTPEGAASLGGSATPVALSPADRTKATQVYNDWAASIDAYEDSISVSAFSSKFDAYLAGNYKFTAAEKAGYELFDGKGNCNSCHLDGRSTQCVDNNEGGCSSSSTTDTGTAALVDPVFTCFGSANEGLPKNPAIAIYYESTPDYTGFTLNPDGFDYTDYGLGTFLRSGFGAAPNPNSSWVQYAPTVDGQFQVSSARNVAMVPPQCKSTDAPGPYFQKEFFHNGYIKSLKQLVHFYNTRDVYRMPVETGECPTGTTEKVNCWPEPEVPQNMDMTTGALGLTDQEENEIVAFLETLTDGYTTPYPDINMFTGTCMTGGTAATQGNSSIISAEALRAKALNMQSLQR
jgi:cytochrome c peroxidase